MNWNLRRWSGLALALAAGPAGAESLSDALGDAYSGNATIQAQRFQQRATDEALPQAQSGWHPSVTLTGSALRSHQYFGLSFPGEKPDQNVTPRQAELVVDQPLYRGGGVDAGIDKAKATIAAGQAQLAAVEQGQLVAAAAAYLDVFRDGHVVELSENLVQVLTLNQHDVQSTYNAGAATETDTSQAAARLAGADAQKLAADSQLKSSLARFKEVVGREAALPLAAPESLGQVPASEADALAQALARNPSLAAARHQLDAARQQVDVVTADLLPRLDGVAQLIHADDYLLKGVRENAAQIGLQATIPLYGGGATYAQLRAAHEAVAAAEKQVTAAERQVATQVSAAWDALVAARAQQTQYRAQIKANQVALDDTIKEVTAGTRTRLDVLNAQQELFSSRVNQVGAEHDTYAATFQLEALMGGFTPSALGLKVPDYDPAAHLDQVKDKWWGTEPPQQ